MTQSLKPSSRLITAWVSRNSRAARGPSGAPSSARRRPRRGAPGRARGSPRGPCPGRRAEQRQLALEARREVRPQPRMRLELEGVGRLVEGDPGPERVERHAERRAVRRMFSSTKSSRPGVGLGRQQREVVLAEHALPRNPSRNPSWRVVSQRLASAIAALVSPPAGGTTWSRVVLELADQGRERRRVGADPAGPVDDTPSARPRRELAPERAPTARARCAPSPRRRRARPRAARLGGQRARRRSQRDRSRSARRPPSRRAPRAPALQLAARRRSPPRRAPSRWMPACQARSSRHGRPVMALRRSSSGQRPELDDSTDTRERGRTGGARRPNRASPVVAGRGPGVPGAVPWTGAPSACAEPVDLEQLGQREAVAVAESTIATGRPRRAAMTGRSSG